MPPLLTYPTAFDSTVLSARLRTTACNPNQSTANDGAVSFQQSQRLISCAMNVQGIPLGPAAAASLAAGPQSTDNYVPTQLTNGDWFNPSTEIYQSITMSDQHCAFSFEELRLNDYSHQRGIATRPHSDFMPGIYGLAVANVRQRLDGFTTQCWSPRRSNHRKLPLGSKIVTFHVGKDTPQDFAIHENLITSTSEFVALALGKDWKEAKDRMIPLPDDNPEVFELLQDWLYSRTITSKNTTHSEKDASEYKLLVSAYILGDKFGIVDFKDAVIDCIIVKLRFTGRFDPRLTNLVYDNTTEKSPLRRLWQEVYFWAGSPSWLDEAQLGDFVHAEFTLDLSKFHMRMIRGGGSMSAPYEDCHLGSGCVYHEHGSGACYRSQLG